MHCGRALQKVVFAAPLHPPARARRATPPCAPEGAHPSRVGWAGPAQVRAWPGKQDGREGRPGGAICQDPRAALQGLIQVQASGSLAGCVCQVKRTHTVTLCSLDLALECLHRGREPCSVSACCSPGCPRVTGPAGTRWVERGSPCAERGPCRQQPLGEPRGYWLAAQSEHSPCW